MQAIDLGPAPLTEHEGGVLRVRGTRVPLETVVWAFDNGATPEEIVQQYPTLDLRNVYAVITYILSRRVEVDAYLALQKEALQDVRAEVERRFPPNGLRERLLARRRAPT